MVMGESEIVHTACSPFPITLRHGASAPLVFVFEEGFFVSDIRIYTSDERIVNLPLNKLDEGTRIAEMISAAYPISDSVLSECRQS